MNSNLYNLVPTYAHGTKTYKFDSHIFSLKNFDYFFFCSKFDVSKQKGNAYINLPDQNKVFVCKQTHGINISEVCDSYNEADGIIIKEGEHAGIFTADCTPVIIYSSKNNVGGILHCGWKSTFNNIIGEFLLKIKKFVTNPNELICLIGPAAQSCCYEVSKDFFEKSSLFLDKFKKKKTNFSGLSLEGDKYKISIPEIVHLQLINCGVLNSNIYRSLDCTICNHDFFSFRRQKEAAGRQLSSLRIL